MDRDSTHRGFGEIVSVNQRSQDGSTPTQGALAMHTAPGRYRARSQAVRAATQRARWREGIKQAVTD